MRADDILLCVARDHDIREANAESGIARVAALAGEVVTLNDLHDALARAVAAGLIADPVRLPPGALQCHWRLELTPAGREVARHGRPASAR